MILRLTWFRVALVAIVLLTCDFQFHRAYYEVRGFVLVELFGVKASLSWPDDGFDEHYSKQFVLSTARGDIVYPERY